MEHLDLNDAVQYKFTLTGIIAVNKDVRPIYNSQGGIRGFATASGNQLLPVMALELNEAETMLTVDAQMIEQGAQILEYVETDFEEVNAF